MASTLQVVDNAYAQYRFDLASQALYDFVWNEFCDWYLELSKPVLWDEDTNAIAALGTRQTLISVSGAIASHAAPLYALFNRRDLAERQPVRRHAGCQHYARSLAN